MVVLFIANSAKNNIMTLTNKYHQSMCLYFSWGNRGNYGMVDNSSVETYACKSSDKANMNINFIEYTMNKKLIAAITN